MRISGAYKVVAGALLCLVLTACAGGPPRALTLEEQNYYMAKQQCAQEADNVFPFYPSPYNPEWNEYFVSCVNSLGVPDAVLERLWY